MTPNTQKVQIPKARPRALLTMEDMGMDHGSHGQMDMSKMDHGSDQPVNMANMNHSQHQMPQGKAPVTPMQKTAMDHRSHEKMDMSKMDHSSHGQMNMSGMDHSAHGQMDMSASATPSDHSQHQMVVSSEKTTSDTVQGWANAATPIGQKALTYADLKSLQSQPERYSRPAERELVIRLGGTMERYIWTIDGKKFSDPDFKPLTVRYGERIRLKFVNESMMAHPMHLHGMFMQLENGQAPQDMPNKHTVIVPPGKTVTALLTADELGEWAIHCHLLYHMSAGMMSKLIVANVDGSKVSQTMSVQPTQGASHAHH